ncbi:hypothetical protein [Fibrella forsythiae]|uniref:Uncharacterized protein n=1 Tax=Fibrella forsythiae TaxID=2817061 RepID=A0ABS3JBX0_9BACT|nr:hypothetical protein [Fibrella forsythiae]MBO0946963.1 hypothetical protein [Fibrella forsythiae]
MIDIRNQAGDRLLLDDDEPLTLEQAAGLMDTDTLPGGFSYPISFPLDGCPPNAKFVGQSHRPSASSAMELPVRLLVDGGLYRNATLSYKLDNGRGSGTLRLDYSASTDELAGKKLVEVLNQPVYLGAMNPNQLPARLGEIARMPPGSFPLTFFPLRNEAFMEEAFTAASLVPPVATAYERATMVNEVDSTGTFLTDNLGTSAPIMGRQLVPFFYLTWVTARLIEQLGYRMAGGWAAQEANQRLVVINMTAMRSSGRSGIAPAANELSEYWAKPGLHLPDMTVAEFLKAVRERYGLFFRWDSAGRVCYVDRFADLLAHPVVDLRGALQLEKASITDATRTGYSVSEYVEAGDELRRNASTREAITLPVQQIGDGKTPVKLRVGTTQMIREIRPGSMATTWDVPIIKTPGNVTDSLYANSERYLNADGSRKNTLGLLILSYQGVTGRDSLGRFYPLATAFPPGESVTLAGRAGGWLSGLRNVFLFRSLARTVIQALLLPVAQASGLLAGQRLHLRTLNGEEYTGLLDTIQTELPAHAGQVRSRLTVRLLPPTGTPPAPAVRPLVYVELEQITRDRLEAKVPYPTAQYPKGLTADTYHRWATLTVRVWADSGRSAPATLSDELVLTLRVRETNDPAAQGTITLAAANPESSMSVPVTQAVQVIDANFEQAFSLVIYVGTATGTTSSATVWNRKRTIQLDPGEGYILL